MRFSSLLMKNIVIKMGEGSKDLIFYQKQIKNEMQLPFGKNSIFKCV